MREDNIMVINLPRVVLPFDQYSSSTVIQAVMDSIRRSPQSAHTYFYFDFNDIEKQQSDKLVRSLIVQLSTQCTDIPEEIRMLYANLQNGQRQPTSLALRTTLHQVIGRLQNTYVIIDALDECGDREDLLELIKELVHANLNHLHVLVTSRREEDIEVSLGSLIKDDDQICIQSGLVDADIHVHIRERLQHDTRLSKWPPNVQVEIEETLMKGANGM